MRFIPLARQLTRLVHVQKALLTALISLTMSRLAHLPQSCGMTVKTVLHAGQSSEWALRE